MLNTLTNSNTTNRNRQSVTKCSYHELFNSDTEMTKMCSRYIKLETVRWSVLRNTAL